METFFMSWGVQGFGFFFFFVFFSAKCGSSIDVFCLVLNVSQAYLDPEAGRQQQAACDAGWQPVCGCCWLAAVVGGCDVGVVAHLFSQCIVVWRSLPQARGSQFPSFNSP
jgi:hypothetical protein